MLTRICALAFILFILISCQPDHSSTPVVNQDIKISGVIYYQNKDGNLSAFDLSQEKVIWTGLYLHNDNNNTVYQDGVIYIASAGNLVAVNAITGTTKWTFRSGLAGTGIIDYCRPVIKDSLVYVIMANGFSPSVYCIRATTGQKIWNRDIVGGVHPDFIYGTPVVVGDKVVGLGHETTGLQNAIMCCDRFTGALKWYDGSITGTLFNYPFSPDSTQIIFMGSYNVEGLISMDINDGHILWKNQAIANNSNNVLPYQHNILMLFGYKMNQVASFDYKSRLMSPVINDTMWRATACRDTIYSMHYDYTMKCRKAGVATTIWERDMPSKKTWDSLSVYPAWQYLQSYFTVPISDNNILCYYENIRAGTQRILNSLYFFNARNGELLKEIKFDDYLPVLGKNMVILKDSVAYYPMLKWGY